MARIILKVTLNITNRTEQKWENVNADGENDYDVDIHSIYCHI